MDFVTDALASDRHLRVLTVVDVFTRQCLALETDTSLGSLRVIRVLEQIIAEHGAPQRIRSDNGPEFTSRAYLAWALERRIELLHIPAWQAHRERLYRKLQRTVARGVPERELVSQFV